MNPDYIPPEIAWPLGIFLWLVLLAMILWDRRKLNNALKERPTLKIMNEKGEWVDVEESDIRPRTLIRRPGSNFYDQDSHAQQPVDIRFEPRVRPASEIPTPPKGIKS